MVSLPLTESININVTSNYILFNIEIIIICNSESMAQKMIFILLNNLEEILITQELVVQLFHVRFWFHTCHAMQWNIII